MAKLGRVLAGLGAVAGGYVQGDRMLKDEARREERDAREREEYEARKTERQRAESDRLTLARALKPATVNEGAVTLDMGDGAKVYDMPEAADVAASDSRQAVRLGMPEPVQQQTAAVNGTAYPSLADAKAAADTYNAPEAVAQRVRGADVSDPSRAITLSQSLVKEGRDNTKWTQEQAAYAKKLADENAFETAKALRTGDPAAIVGAFNRSGDWKIEGEPQVKPAERDLPGFGKVKTYDVTVNLRGKDGQQITKTVNSHDFSMSILPYEKSLEMQRKGVDSDNKFQYQQAMIDTKIKQLELAGNVAEAKALAAAAKAAASGGQLGREERLRFTSLFTDAGRRMAEGQKTLTTLLKNGLYSTAQPGSPQAQELDTLRESIAAYKQERELYGGLLAGSQTPGKEPAAAAPKPAKDGKAGPARPASKAEYDKLPKGTRYIHPDGTERVKG